jgi:uncharacterized iron-regulated protein
MLGEIHDNAEQHRRRLERLRQAFADGWRPAIAMEQFDRDHQPDIERARRERPGDAQYLIDQAAPASPAGSGWDWALYRPFVALALEYDVPLIALNLSMADTSRIFKGGYAAVFDPAALGRLHLDAPIAPDWETAQEHEIAIGHCNQLPPTLLPRMAAAQFARDAVMAETVAAHADHGLVMLAGDGHVRRDLGVPRWLSPALQSRVFAVGYLEKDTPAGHAAFDVAVITPAASRADPCRSPAVRWRTDDTPASS